MQPTPGAKDDDDYLPELEPDVDDLDADLDGGDETDDRAPSRSSLLEPGPLSLAGLILSCVSFLTIVPVDDAIDARLLGNTDNATRLAAFAERAAASRMVIAGIGLVLCGIASYLDDETDPRWARTAARAGIIIALVSLVIYLAAILLGASVTPPVDTGQGLQG